MVRQREEIDPKYKWNLTKMYSSKDDIEKDIELVKELGKKIETFKGRLKEGKETFLEVLKLYEKSSRIFQNLYVYSHMKQHEDTRVGENQGLATRTEMLEAENSTSTSFIVPEILELDDEILINYKQDKEISFYNKFLDDITRMKPHTLGQKEEEILAATSEIVNVSENVYDMLCYADMKFPEITDEKGEKVRITPSNYSIYIMSNDRRVRKEAFEAEFQSYKAYKNTFASTLYGAIKSEIFYSKIRNYESARQASLFADDISLEVYDNLIDAVDQNIATLNKYVDIKKNLLGLEKINMYDLYAPVVSDFEMKITYEEAQEIILKALEPMGNDYLSVIKEAFSQNWIDVYENEGKKSGAYSWGSYDSNPYILMNYNDDLNSMFTLIHELGHSVHSYYSKKNQPYIYYNYKIFVAEVASTVNEQLLINYLLKNSKSKQEKMYLLNYYLEQFRTTVFRQTMFAEFEKIVHSRVEAGQPITADDFTSIYYDLNKKYYGTSTVVDDLIGFEWARIPHFYSNFYVYKYATGFSAASYLSNKILSNDKQSIDKYLNFLKSGGADYPLNQLRDAGIDMEKKESIIEAMKVFEKLVDELQKLSEE
ncbi:MAG: oligoendopeptidase F [Clostridioides sp.]|jgi:oligoendopeptidase F|nr:oligoendopeptidase F [Clostridioides sp.]